MARYLSGLSLTLGITLFVYSCTPVGSAGRRPTSPRPAASISSLQAYVLLGDNRLLLVAADGTIRQVADLMHHTASDTSGVLAGSSSGRATLFMPSLRPKQDQVPLSSLTPVQRALFVS